jgi:hypothetical protein
MPIEPEQQKNLRASVINRFRRVAVAPLQERKFPVGPPSAKELGYERAANFVGYSRGTGVCEESVDERNWWE